MTDLVPIWFAAFHLGDIEVATDGALQFAYGQKWLAMTNAFLLSITMPLRMQPYPTHVMSPWLANLLPEEEQLSVLTSSLGLDCSDTLAVLKEIGGDTAGALSFGTKSKREDWDYIPLTIFYETSDPQLALARQFEGLKRRPFLVGEAGVRVSLAGGQRKSALAVLGASGGLTLRLPEEGAMLAIARNGAPSTIILRPDNPLLPGIVENETYCLHLARAIGMEAAQASIIYAGDRKAICVLHYDRQLSRTGTLLRIHQEDFAQANGVPPRRK